MAFHAVCPLRPYRNGDSSLCLGSVLMLFLPTHVQYPVTGNRTVNGSLGVIANTFRFLKNGEHARKTCASPPIRHISCISPYFVKAGRQKLVQPDVSPCLSLLHLELPPLYHITCRIQQFHIQHAAQIRRFPRICPHYVCLEPYRLTDKIARIVEMEVYFFLGIQ